jgi:Fic family protein
MYNMKIVDKLYTEWQSLQPISSEAQSNIDRKFMLEFNYNSNHIEGNTLTYGQTELLLMFDQVDGDAKMHDLEEMKAHNVGLKMMQEEAHSTERTLSEYFIKNLHKTLIREDYTVRKELPDGNITTYTVHAGQYKTRPNSVITATGERCEYASPEETPALMTDLIDWYNGAVD